MSSFFQVESRAQSDFQHSKRGRGRFKSRLFKYGMTNSPACRFCDREDETDHHIFFDCPVLSENRKLLRSKCEALDVDFNLRNLFTEAKLQRNVESYLYETFNRYDDDKKLFFVDSLDT